MIQERHPWRLKDMTPGAITERLLERPTLIVPVGTTEQHGPHLPLGCDTIIVERIADDLSEKFGIARTPTVEYGVHATTRPYPGGAALRRRTLHRVMNELIESWEEGAGVREFFIITAQSSEAHLEALSAIRTDEATVQVVDIFSIEFGSLLERPAPIQGGELDTSLLLFLAPQMCTWSWPETSIYPRRCCPATGPETAGTCRRAPPDRWVIPVWPAPRRVSACIDLSSTESAPV